MSDCPHRPKKIEMQPNVSFDTETELKNWVKANHPLATICKIWEAKVFRCRIKLNEPKGIK